MQLKQFMTIFRYFNTKSNTRVAYNETHEVSFALLAFRLFCAAE